jgi:hypothetical protein
MLEKDAILSFPLAKSRLLVAPTTKDSGIFVGE